MLLHVTSLTSSTDTGASSNDRGRFSASFKATAAPCRGRIVKDWQVKRRLSCNLNWLQAAMRLVFCLKCALATQRKIGKAAVGASPHAVAHLRSRSTVGSQLRVQQWTGPSCVRAPPLPRCERQQLLHVFDRSHAIFHQVSKDNTNVHCSQRRTCSSPVSLLNFFMKSSDSFETVRDVG